MRMENAYERPIGVHPHDRLTPHTHTHFYPHVVRKVDAVNQGILVDESEEFQDYRRTVAAKRSTRDKARIRGETNTL